MSDLEDLWDELPTGKPPVDAVLAAGRADDARRRKLRQTVLAVGATAAVVGAFVAGAAVGNRPGPTVAGSQSDARMVAFQADLKPAQSCDELLASYHDRALSLVTAWGWEGPFGRMSYGAGDVMEDLALGPSATASGGERSQVSSETGTNVQETGVDEPDTVKTDGTLVVRVQGSDLVVHDASGSKVVERSTIRLPRLEDPEILLAGSTVVAIGKDSTSPRDEMSGERRGSRVITVSIDDEGKAEIESTVTYESRVISARQHGSTVRLVLAAGLPDLGFVQPDGNKLTEHSALVANRLAVKASTISDWLPTYDSGSGSEQLLDCTNVAVPHRSAGLDTVSVVGFDAEDPAEPRAIGLAGATTIAYESADHLYLADAPAGWGCRMCGPVMRGDVAAPARGSGTTHLYDFELDGLDASHVASGEVEGTIADRWSLDEADDVLRVAVGPSIETGNFNSVVTFKREGDELTEIGRVDGLGRNEELKGVRWFDDLAVVVTFRQVDPLYTIDLTDPAKPRLLGKLKIPGYSDYLHPLGEDEMLGIGFDGVSGAQIALFDTSNLEDVRRTAVETYRGAEAIATWEPRAFTWLPDHDTALTVIQKGSEVEVATLKVGDGKLTSTLTQVEHGADARLVRTLGLPDGRVVLVTGEDVRFFKLP